MSVTHFIQWDRQFKYSDLELLASRRAGCILQRNEDGIDLLVPVWWVPEGGSEKRWGAVVIQVKNKSETSDMHEAGYKLYPQSIFSTQQLQEIPLLRMVFELRSGREPGEKHRGSQSVEMFVTAEMKTDTDAKGNDMLYEVEARASSGRNKTFRMTSTKISKSLKYKFLRFIGMDSFNIVCKRDVVLRLHEMLLESIDPIKWHTKNTVKTGEISSGDSIVNFVKPGRIETVDETMPPLNTGR